jgi:hypothetical protein
MLTNMIPSITDNVNAPAAMQFKCANRKKWPTKAAIAAVDPTMNQTELISGSNKGFMKEAVRIGRASA